MIMKVLTTDLGDMRLTYKAVLVRGLALDGPDLIAVQVQGNLYVVIPPAAAPSPVARVEGVSESEARAILAAGYECEILGAVRAPRAAEAAAGKGGCGRGN